MNRRGSAEPWATDMKEPIPNLATSLGPKTSQLIAADLARAWAALPSMLGVAWLAGRLAHSLANSMPRIMATVVLNAVSNAAVTLGKAKVT